MLSITFNEWFGPTREGNAKVPVIESTTTFVTDMTLPEALLHVHAYQIAHNLKYKATAIEFEFLTAIPIDYLNSQVRLLMNIILIEDLPTSTDEIE